MNSHFEVLKTIISRGPLPKRELVELLDLSAPSLTRIVKYWVGQGCLEVRSSNDPGAGSTGTITGRPVEPVHLKPDCAHFIGVNLRGEGLTTVLMNAGGQILFSDQAPLPDYAPLAIAKAVAISIAKALQQPISQKLAGIGVSLGGAIGPDSIVERAPFFFWQQTHFLPHLEEQLAPLAPKTPIYLCNDVEALTKFELLYGAGKREDNFALLTFGAGVGHGMVHERRVVTIPAQGIGYIGHLPVANGWGQCHRGHDSCTSAVVTLRGLRTLLPASLAQVPALSPTDIQLSDLAIAQIVQAYQNDQKEIRHAVDRYIKTAGQLISTVAAVSMTNLVSIAGESVDIFALNLDLLRAGADHYRNPTLPPLEIELRESNFQLWAQGAATVAVLEYFSAQS